MPDERIAMTDDATRPMGSESELVAAQSGQLPAHCVRPAPFSTGPVG
jgi:hypothetical protein